MDSFDCKNEWEEQEVMNRHYEAIFAHPRWRTVLKIFIPENNYAMPDHLANMVVHHRVEIYRQHPDRIGVYKDGRVTEEYRYRMSMGLFHKRLAFSSAMFTRTPNKTAESMRAMLRNQMETYHYANKNTAGVFGTNRRKLTGKVGGQQDDLLVTYMMGYAWGQKCWDDPKYRQLARL